VAQIELLRRESFTGSVGYSADGRFILQGDFGSGNPEVMWHFMDRETGNLAYAFASLSTLTGTPDGQWYVQYSHNYLLLHAPAYNYHYFVRHNLEDCQQMALSVDE
jgi:hypothetical protein